MTHFWCVQRCNIPRGSCNRFALGHRGQKALLLGVSLRPRFQEQLYLLRVSGYKSAPFISLRKIQEWKMWVGVVAAYFTGRQGVRRTFGLRAQSLTTFSHIKLYHHNLRFYHNWAGGYLNWESISHCFGMYWLPWPRSLVENPFIIRKGRCRTVIFFSWNRQYREN